MIKLMFLFWSVFCFSQVEKHTNINLTKPNTNDSISNNTAAVGYQFYKAEALLLRLNFILLNNAQTNNTSVRYVF